MLIEIIKKIILGIILQTWEKATSLAIEVAILSLGLFLAATFIPHGIPVLTAITYWGWVIIVIIFKLLNTRIYKPEETTPISVDEPPLVNQDVDDEESYPIDIPNEKIKNILSEKEIKEIKNDNTSTRE